MDTSLRSHKIKVKKENLKIFFIVLISCVAGFITAVLLVGHVRGIPVGTPGYESDRNSVAVVYVEGIIANSESVIRHLKEAEKGDYPAVVIRINSPGGLVSPTWEIYRAVRKLREKKPVVASIETVGASGGYYIASACDKILVTPGTITGSIGVIIESWNVKKIFDRVGVKNVVIKSGKMKDILSPYRNLTGEEKQYLQDLVNEMYMRFLMDVAEGRGLNVEEVKPYADGRIITGEDAVRIGLADKIGTFEDAVDEAGRLAGLRGRPKVVKLIKHPSLLKKILGTLSSSFSGKIFSEVLNIVQSPEMKGLYFAYLVKGFYAGGEK